MGRKEGRKRHKRGESMVRGEREREDDRGRSTRRERKGRARRNKEVTGRCRGGGEGEERRRERRRKIVWKGRSGGGVHGLLQRALGIGQYCY